LFEAQVVPSGKQPELQQTPFGEEQVFPEPQLTDPVTGAAFGFTRFCVAGQTSAQVSPV